MLMGRRRPASMGPGGINASGCGSGSSRGVGRRRLGVLQIDDEGGALAGLALDVDLAAVALDDGARDREAEAGAGLGAREEAARLIEALEHAAVLGLRQPRAVVLHADRHAPALSLAREHRDLFLR